MRGQQRRVVEHAFSANAVFLASHAGFQRAQAAEFAFHRHANLVGHFHHAARHVDVVVEVGRGLAVFTQRAVHHDRAEAQVDGALADRRALAVILVHHQRDLRIGFNGGLDQVLDEGLAGVLASACAGLQDHRRAGFLGGFHHGLDLLQVVHVECRQAVAVFSGVVQQLAHGNEWHGFLLWVDLYSVLRNVSCLASNLRSVVGVRPQCMPTRTILSVLVPPACPIGSPTVRTMKSPRCTTPRATSSSSA